MTCRLEQELDEAKTTVEKRLQYIDDEMSVPLATLTNRHSSQKVRHKYETLKKHLCRKRTQKHLTDLENRCEEKKVKMMQLQQQLRKPPPKPEGIAE